MSRAGPSVFFFVGAHFYCQKYVLFGLLYIEGTNIPRDERGHLSQKSESAKLRKTHRFLEHTTRVWQPRSRRHLTHEDAREIISNASGFFSLLAEWDCRTGTATPDDEGGS